jgi:hypothetical protein
MAGTIPAMTFLAELGTAVPVRIVAGLLWFSLSQVQSTGSLDCASDHYLQSSHHFGIWRVYSSGGGTK